MDGESTIKFKSGEEAILFVLKGLTPAGMSPFDLSEPIRRSVYRQVYTSFLEKAGKGCLLVGSIGIGKTIMMKSFQKLFVDTPRQFKWTNPLKLKDMMEEFTVSEIKQLYGKILKSDLYVDDLGLGAIEYKKHGNVVNILAEIMWERHELFIESGGEFRTHYSTNIPTTVPADTPEEVKSIERLYGDRLLDRLIESTKLITWTGTSLRSKIDYAKK